MAVLDYTQLTSITREKILPGIVDQIKNDSPVLEKLLGKGRRLDGGKRIEQIIRYANSTEGGWYSGLDTLDTGQMQTRTRAYWDWAQAHQPIVFSNIDLAKNGGAGKVLDLLKTETEDAKEALKYKFSTALYTAQSGDQMESLVDACDDGTNVASYGGINRSNYSWWAGSYNGTGGALSLTMMATRYDDVKSGSDSPDMIVTDETTWSLYEALLQPQVRFTFTTGGYPKTDGGFQAMMFRGTPVIADESCTSGYEKKQTNAHSKFSLILGNLRFRKFSETMAILWKQLMLNFQFSALLNA